jgi:hypothetical protein
MRYCKIDISRPFLQRLKFWFCGGVILVSADFEMSLVHAQGRDSHGLPVHQQNAAISSNLANLGRFDHLSQPSYRTAIALMLGLRRHADAAKLANEILERYPRASELHFQIATMFQHFRRCTTAKPFFQKMRILYRSSPQWPLLRKIEKACGDLWIQDAIMQLRVGRQKSLIDAPQQDIVPIAKGSQIDQFCQLQPYLCGDARHIRHNVFAPSGYLTQMTTKFMMSRPDYQGGLQQLTLQLAKNVTSQPAIGSDGFALRYLVGWHRENRILTTIAARLGKSLESRGRDAMHHQMSWAGLDFLSLRRGDKKTVSYQHGLSIERYWADQMTGQLVRLHGAIAGCVQNEIDWQIGCNFERRYRLFHGWRRSASFGNQFHFDLRWPLSSHWLTIISYQDERRYFLTPQPYLVAPYTVLTKRLKIRFETKIDWIDSFVIGTELDRYIVRSKDQFARRHRVNYAIYIRYQF